MSRLWTPNRPPLYMAPYGGLVGACRPKMQQPAAAPSSLLTDLVAYYKLEEASGTRIDATLRGNDLTDNNTVGQAAGKVGNAASFVAANSEYLSIASNADVVMGDIDFTFAAWVQPTSLPAVDVREDILSKWNGAIADREYALTLENAAGTVRFKLGARNAANSASAAAVADTLGTPTTGTWYLVLGYYDAASDLLGIIVNTLGPDTVALVGGVRVSGQPLAIGAQAQPTSYWPGLIDELGIWKRILTAAERTALYNGGNGITYPFVGT